MADRQNESSYELSWTAFAVQDGKAPDVDTVIEVRRGESIHMQVDTTATANVSTSTDINVITSSDGTNYDTVAYASLAALADAAVQSIMVTPGPKFMKLTADNNDGVNSSAPIVRVWIRS